MYLSTVFTSSGRELKVGVGRQMDEMDFSSAKFLTVSILSSIILLRGGPGRLVGETSPEATNLLINLDRVTIYIYIIYVQLW